jgi:glutamyl-tRNA synthetase
MKGENTHKIVTRFAPSPTGFMHVGNVRTAIFAYLWAKHTGGSFILRIEDTDKAREVEGSKEHIIEALTWLGITWDQGPIVGGPHAPYIQSERLDMYQKYARILIEKGYAYVDGTSEEEAEKLRTQADAEKRPFLYREHRIESSEPYTGKGQSLRFKINEVKKTTWQDVAFGELTAGEEALDDFILIKADGYPTYNFAHVIDDIEMGVTHVMRGQEFISSTPKFLALYNALEIEPPVFVSMPHILGDNGQKKLGKRDGAKDILDYRTEGYEPQALFNFLAFLGFNPGGEQEVYTRQELINVFDITRIQKSGARFNDEKLNWFNKEHIKLLSPTERIKKVAACIPDKFNAHDELISKIEAIVTERISTWTELKNCMNEGEFDYFFVDPVITDNSKIIWKESTMNKAKDNLNHVIALIEPLEATDWTYESLKQTIWPVTETLGRGDVLWPLRYVLSGRDKSPDPFMLLYILGKETAIKRIKSIL